MKIDSSNPYVVDLSPEEFLHLPQRPLLIDVRFSLEYRASHVPNAVNLSLPRILMGMSPIFRPWVLPQWFRDLPKDQPLAVICLTAHRSPIAAKQLVKAGFPQVYNITGGMREWWRLEFLTSKN
ncbi:Rhodanese domain protein [Gloeothece citriformis PCC 7424]|uniref:Rhodanese domain protein n=1 Tax=Gloeothece citriformis (strain PCC 7424) TaxID=65393 RepID=B7KB19_GLOC7|nr:rhodanese-like domain-containing protein [Gloeothece citriformis]ACK70129.1 Rhodanese domain protein [Gloeothece citriformis PCC 7424]